MDIQVISSRVYDIFVFMKLSKIIIVLFLLLATWSVRSQSISFSYLIPKNGYLAAPVSPFSLRGLGIGNKVGIETGATLYNVPGLSMTDLPFTSSEPLTGPHFAVLVPLNAFTRFKLGSSTFKFLGGGFLWWNINTRLHTGHLDQALREMENWQVLTSQLSLNDQLGLGWMAGMEISFPFNKQVDLVFGINYLKGGASSRLEGTYAGGNIGDTIIEKPFISSPSIQIEGLEISLGGRF